MGRNGWMDAGNYWINRIPRGGIVWQRCGGSLLRCQAEQRKTGERKRCIHVRKQLRYISIVDRIQLKTGDVFRLVQGLGRGGSLKLQEREKREKS